MTGDQQAEIDRLHNELDTNRRLSRVFKGTWEDAVARTEAQLKERHANSKQLGLDMEYAEQL